MDFFNSVEFYVIAAVVAAAVVGLCVKPAHKGEARKYLLAGKLDSGESGHMPEIELSVADDGKVTLTRRGLSGMIRASGALSLAVTVAGFEISVEERLTPGHQSGEIQAPDEAVFVLDFLGREHYHLKYYSEAMGAMAATPLHVRPGIDIVKPLL